MTEWWWPFLFVGVGAFVAHNMLAGYLKGVIEMRGIVVRRAEDPGLFWFTFAADGLFLVMSIALLGKWLLGDPTFG
jgi:nitrate reductase gamma subunit